jgi:hypothetical protein
MLRINLIALVVAWSTIHKFLGVSLGLSSLNLFMGENTLKRTHFNQKMVMYNKYDNTQ